MVQLSGSRGAGAAIREQGSRCSYQGAGSRCSYQGAGEQVQLSGSRCSIFAGADPSPHPADRLSEAADAERKKRPFFEMLLLICRYITNWILQHSKPRTDFSNQYGVQNSNSAVLFVVYIL